MRLGGKGVLVHSSGRALYGYNVTSGSSFTVATTDVAVSVLDVDSSRRHVYWVDATRMRRAILNDNATLFAQPQDLCSVRNATGIAYDWIARSVKRQPASAIYRCLLVHGQLTIIFVVSVGLPVCLCRVFLSRL